MTSTLRPSAVIGAVAKPLAGLPACIAGSTVAAETYNLPLLETSEVDVFCYTEQTLLTALEKLANAGFTLNDRFVRVRDRWLKYGLRNWHTNSIKFEAPASFDFVEVNLVYKLVGGNPLNSLSSVLESFDFGLLATGYELSDGKYRDMRSYLFPGMDINGPLPLMPNKEDAWKNGFISRYNGLRESGRYAKYFSYGHDLSLVKPVLVNGYFAAALYLENRGDDDKVMLANIYKSIAMHIENEDIDELLEANKTILTLDSLDQIMEALE